MNRWILCTAMTGAVAFGMAAVTDSFSENAPPKAEAAAGAEQVSQAPPFLGVAVAEAPPVKVDGRRAPVLVVSHIHPGSPAELAGLKTGDVLLKIEDQKLYDPLQLRRLVMDMSLDQQVQLTVLRDGQLEQLQATLAPRPEELALQLRPDRPAPMPEGQDWPRLFDQPLGGMDQNADERIREMHRQMDEQFEQLRQMLRQPDGQFPEVHLPNAQGGEFQPGVQSSVTFDDGTHRLTVTTNPKGQHLKAVDSRSGEVLFDGPIDTPKQKQAIPEEIRGKLPQVQEIGPNPHGQPGDQKGTEPVGRAV